VISLDSIRDARSTIGDRLHRTPILTSRTLGELFGGTAFIKAELFQRTGSFKPRGVLNKLAALTDAERARGIIGLSAGNHAQALAYGAALEQLDALVVMWDSASPQKIEATISYGAQVDLTSTGPETAFQLLDQLIEETGRVLVHPFDDPLIVAGQGTVGLEIVEDLQHLDAVIVPVGGGGLLAGVATAVKELSPRTRVIAVEPDGAAALHRFLVHGEEEWITPRSMADGLNSPFAGVHAREASRTYGVESVVVTNEAIAEATRFLYRYAKLACEPSGAAAVAAVLSSQVEFGANSRVAFVVSGGNVHGAVAGEILASG
jgi:threonine dehydratase